MCCYVVHTYGPNNFPIPCLLWHSLIKYIPRFSFFFFVIVVAFIIFFLTAERKISLEEDDCTNPPPSFLIFFFGKIEHIFHLFDFMRGTEQRMASANTVFAYEPWP